MPYGEIAAFFDPGFDLPIRGKTYRISDPGHQEGLYLQALMDTGTSLALTRKVSSANKLVLSDEEERSAYQMALGAAYEQMVADGLTWSVIKHAGTTAWLHWTRGAEAGERFWASYGNGQGKAPTADPSQTSSDTSPQDQSTPTPA